MYIQHENVLYCVVLYILKTIKNPYHVVFVHIQHALPYYMIYDYTCVSYYDRHAFVICYIIYTIQYDIQPYSMIYQTLRNNL